jgi:hypothetical protein
LPTKIFSESGIPKEKLYAGVRPGPAPRGNFTSIDTSKDVALWPKKNCAGVMMFTFSTDTVEFAGADQAWQKDLLFVPSHPPRFGMAAANMANRQGKVARERELAAFRQTLRQGFDLYVYLGRLQGCHFPPPWQPCPLVGSLGSLPPTVDCAAGSRGRVARIWGRNRRPPRDPVNAALSFTYTLLHFDAVRAAHGAGLDPMVGFYHRPAHGRESLACDLIEPLRPRADAWVRMLFRERELRGEHFATNKGACLLGKAGRERFHAAWESYASVPPRWLRRQCATLAGTLRSSGEALLEPGDEHRKLEQR